MIERGSNYGDPSLHPPSNMTKLSSTPGMEHLDIYRMDSVRAESNLNNEVRYLWVYRD